MSLNKFLLASVIGGALPDFNPNYCWEVQWLFEDEQCPPHIENHADPQKALDHMIQIWNSHRVIVHISVSRRNA